MRWSRTAAACVAATVVALAAIPAWSYPATYNSDPNFPDYYQQDPAVNNGGCACAPVAATDSLFWLAQRYKGLGNLTKGKTWQQLTNTLENDTYMKTATNGATYAGNFADGKAQYIKDVGLQNKIKQRTQLGGSGTPTTIDFIKSEVAAGEDVELLVLWMKDPATPGDPASNVGGHWVAVTGYDQNNLYVADPWNDNNSNKDKTPITGNKDVTLNFDSYGMAKTKYTQEYPTIMLNDGLDFGMNTYQIIFAAVSESPIGEPASVLLVALGFGGAAAATGVRKRG